MSESEEDAAKRNWQFTQHSQNMQGDPEQQFQNAKAQYLQKLTQTGMGDAGIDRPVVRPRESQRR